MSTPKTRPLPRDYTGRWHHARFLRAATMAGVPVGERGAPQALAILVTQHRCSRGDETAVSRYVAQRWLDGTQDPSIGAAGRPPSAYDIAGALGVSLDWLLTGPVKP